MRIVVQCASKKDEAAASFLAHDGRPILFVARPDVPAPSASQVYARPDDLAVRRQTWRGPPAFARDGPQ